MIFYALNKKYMFGMKSDIMDGIDIFKGGMSIEDSLGDVIVLVPPITKATAAESSDVLNELIKWAPFKWKTYTENIRKTLRLSISDRLNEISYSKLFVNIFDRVKGYKHTRSVRIRKVGMGSVGYDTEKVNVPYNEIKDVLELMQKITNDLSEVGKAKRKNVILKYRSHHDNVKDANLKSMVDKIKKHTGIVEGNERWLFSSVDDTKKIIEELSSNKLVNKMVEHRLAFRKYVMDSIKNNNVGLLLEDISELYGWYNENIGHIKSLMSEIEQVSDASHVVRVISILGKRVGRGPLGFLITSLLSSTLTKTAEELLKNIDWFFQEGLLEEIKQNIISHVLCSGDIDSAIEDVKAILLGFLTEKYYEDLKKEDSVPKFIIKNIESMFTSLIDDIDVRKPGYLDKVSMKSTRLSALILLFIKLANISSTYIPSSGIDLKIKDRNIKIYLKRKMDALINNYIYQCSLNEKLMPIHLEVPAKFKNYKDPIVKLAGEKYEEYLAAIFSLFGEDKEKSLLGKGKKKGRKKITVSDITEKITAKNIKDILASVLLLSIIVMVAYFLHGYFFEKAKIEKLNKKNLDSAINEISTLILEDAIWDGETLEISNILDKVNTTWNDYIDAEKDVYPVSQYRDIDYMDVMFGGNIKLISQNIIPLSRSKKDGSIWFTNTQEALKYVTDPNIGYGNTLVYDRGGGWSETLPLLPKDILVGFPMYHIDGVVERSIYKKINEIINKPDVEIIDLFLDVLFEYFNIDDVDCDNNPDGIQYGQVKTEVQLCKNLYRNVMMFLLSNMPFNMEVDNILMPSPPSHLEYNDEGRLRLDSMMVPSEIIKNIIKNNMSVGPSISSRIYSHNLNIYDLVRNPKSNASFHNLGGMEKRAELELKFPNIHYNKLLLLSNFYYIGLTINTMNYYFQDARPQPLIKPKSIHLNKSINNRDIIGILENGDIDIGVQFLYDILVPYIFDSFIIESKKLSNQLFRERTRRRFIPFNVDYYRKKYLKESLTDTFKRQLSYILHKIFVASNENNYYYKSSYRDNDIKIIDNRRDKLEKLGKNIFPKISITEGREINAKLIL